MKTLLYSYSIGMLILLCFACAQDKDEGTRITDLTVNYSEDPIGIEKDGMLFSWKMKSDVVGMSQKEYQIVVTNDKDVEIWNSGLVTSNLSVAIPYEGPELSLETGYHWIVSVTCSDDKVITSKKAYFETGTSFKDAEWIYYEPVVENCFKNSMSIKVKPTIIENGFTLYFGIKNDDNRFAWSFTKTSLVATKINPVGNVQLDNVELASIVKEKVPFDLIITAEDKKITTLINGKEISIINNEYPIERPYVGLFVAQEQTDFRTRRIVSPAQSAKFDNLILTVDDNSEQIGESSFTLTPPKPNPADRGGFRPGAAPGGVTFIQQEFNGKPVEYLEESTVMPLFRTEKELAGKVKSARLYISSLGIFDAFLNGKEVMQVTKEGKVLDDIFSPGWTNYNDYIYYRTYDVTDYLDGKKVAIGARVGNGWYAGLIGREYYGDIGKKGENELSIIAKLVVDYADGTQEIITTNTDDWSVSVDGPVLMNDLFIGEIYDARLEKNVEGWKEINFDASNWSKVSKLQNYNPNLIGGNENTAYMLEELRIIPKSSEDTYIFDPENIDFSTGLDYGQVITETVDPGKDIKLEKGKKLMVDLGQNIAGVTGISVSGPEGTQIRLQGAEMLNDGKKNPNKARGAGSCGPKGTLYLTGLTRAREYENDWYTDVYYLNDQEVQDYRASFTFHGYRYLEITTDNDIVIHNIYAQPMTSVTKQTGIIETNNETVNRLFKNTLWSQMTNHITIPTDCPNRSERLGWSGDITVFAETALYNFDAFNFMNNYMEIASNYVGNNDGKFGSTMPGPSEGAGGSEGGFFGGRTNAGWTDVGIILTWALYLQTGDIAVLEENYDLLAAYMDELIEEGLRAGYGDWVALQTTSGVFMAGVYQAYDAVLMSKIAEAVGKKSDAEKYKAEYERMRGLLYKKYVDDNANLLSVTADNITSGGFMGTGIIQDNSQTSILWALKMGLYNSEEEKEIFIKNLIENIDNVEGKVRAGQGEKTLSTGFLGVNVLLPVLTENGLANTAYDLLLQDEQPSWLYEVNQGATTTWERWNAYSHINSFEDNGMNSFNHYAYGAVGEWMFEYMAGIQKDDETPGFKNIILQPTIDRGSAYNDQPRIKEVSGEYESYYGKIKSGWISDENNLKYYEAIVPPNTTATLYLPLDEVITENSCNLFNDIKGVTFSGITKRNGIEAAEFHLLSGGYKFEIENENLVAKLLEGYININ